MIRQWLNTWVLTNSPFVRALLFSLKQLWRTFHPFVVLTDHNTDIFISKMQNKNHRLTRWGFVLQEYNLIIHHIKCNDNCIGNVLSWIEIDVYCKKCVSNLFLQERRFYVYIINMRYYFVHLNILFCQEHYIINSLSIIRHVFYQFLLLT